MHYCVLASGMYTRLTPPSRKIQAVFSFFAVGFSGSFSFISATIFVTNKFCSCLQCSIYSEFDSVFFSFWQTEKTTKKNICSEKKKWRISSCVFHFLFFVYLFGPFFFLFFFFLVSVWWHRCAHVDKVIPPQSNAVDGECTLARQKPENR